MDWFDPPFLKAQKVAAKQARALRQQAARDAGIEVQMLANRYNFSARKHGEVYQAGNLDLAGRFLMALGSAQECLDRAGRLAEGIPMGLAESHNKPKTGSDYEALATFELEARGHLLELRAEAKEQVQLLGRLSAEAMYLEPASR